MDLYILYGETTLDVGENDFERLAIELILAWFKSSGLLVLKSFWRLYMFL